MAKPDKSKEISLKFDFKKISAEQFKLGVDSFIGLIQEVSRSISGEERIKWTIKVKGSDPQIIAIPDFINGELPQDAIDTGVLTLEEKPLRPEKFSDLALRQIKSLASLSNEENQIKIGVNSTFRNLTHKSVANVNELLGGKKKAYGSLDGKLNLIADRGGLRFEILDRLTGVNVRCYFNQEDIENVVGAFRKRVKISGLLNYRKDGTIVSIKVDELRIIEDKERPDFYNMIGILSD